MSALSPRKIAQARAAARAAAASRKAGPPRKPPPRPGQLVELETEHQDHIKAAAGDRPVGYSPFSRIT